MSGNKNNFGGGVLGRVWNILSKPETTIPIEEKPLLAALNWDKYKTIDFFSKRNQFAKDLLLLSEISPTHRSCIYTKADYAYSEGFGIVKGKNQSLLKTKMRKETEVVTDEVIAATANAISNVNSYNESFLEVCRQARINLNASGNAYLELVWGKLGSKKYFQVYCHDFNHVLLVTPENNRKEVTHAYISEDWSNEFISRNPPEKLPLFPEVKESNGSFRTLMHIKEYSVGRNYYGLPLFVASKVAAQLEYESDRHNLERFFSDFMPKFFAAFFAPGGMTDNEREEFYESFLNTYTKQGRNGQVQAMVQVFESENLRPYFHEFGNNNSEGDFIDLKTNANQSIFTAHRWHPVLAGIPISAGLNDSKQIENVFSIYNRISIKPMQVFDLTNFINPVFEMMCEWMKLPAIGHQLTLESSSPISFYSDIDVNSVLTVDEARQHLGQDKLGDERGASLITDAAKAMQKDLNQQKPTS